MRRLLRPDVGALLGLALGVVLAACPLPSNVRYRCEPNGTCAQADHRCAADGYCYAGACTPRDTAAECAQVECGLVADGCGGFMVRTSPRPGTLPGTRRSASTRVISLVAPIGGSPAWSWIRNGGAGNRSRASATR